MSKRERSYRSRVGILGDVWKDKLKGASIWSRFNRARFPRKRRIKGPTCRRFSPRSFSARCSVSPSLSATLDNKVGPKVGPKARARKVLALENAGDPGRTGRSSSSEQRRKSSHRWKSGAFIGSKSLAKPAARYSYRNRNNSRPRSIDLSLLSKSSKFFSPKR